MFEKHDIEQIAKKLKFKNIFLLIDEVYFYVENNFFDKKNFFKKYPNVISIQQKGKSTFYRRRTKKDSILNINLPIKKLFNQMRIANNEKWPSFFIYKKKKYVIKIFEDNVQDRKKNHF